MIKISIYLQTVWSAKIPSQPTKVSKAETLWKCSKIKTTQSFQTKAHSQLRQPQLIACNLFKHQGS